jgi:predicted nucleic acid-binding protein
MLCLDSTFLIDFLRNNPDAVKKTAEIMDETLATTSINVFEVLFGIYARKDASEKDLKIFESFISNLNILPFDLNASMFASKIGAELKHKGKDIGAVDCFIAGSMISGNCRKILTRNRGHFERIAQLKAESY